jgi:hypothetical protein
MMHPLDNSKAKNFSAASIRDICSNIGLYGSCLKPVGSAKSFQQNVCQNGIRELSEQCDCGTPEECTDPCCNPENCLLKRNAVCADQNDICCKNCQYKPADSICHASLGVCDRDLVHFILIF